MAMQSALIFLFGATFFYSLNGVLLKRAAVSIPPFAAMAISMAILFVLSCIFTMRLEKNFSWNLLEDRGGLVAIVAVGFVNTVAFWCFLKALGYVSVWQYQMFALLIPILTAILAFFFLGETFTWKLFVGLGFVGVGLFIALR